MIMGNMVVKERVMIAVAAGVKMEMLVTVYAIVETEGISKTYLRI